jgi:dolichyl-phosphate-mannose-protein mannosyltransferase
LTGDWSNPLTRAAQLFTIPATITFANSSHPSALHPWQWVLGYHIMPFQWTPQYMAAVTPTVWAATIPVFGWTTWLSWRRRNEAAVFGAAWIFATLILWIIIGGITNRITYIFYFVPIIGGIILGLALFIDKAIEWSKRPRQLLLKLYDKPKFKERFIAWSRRRNWKKIVTVGLVLFMITHVILFWVFSPFNWLWPVIHP